MHNLIGLVCTIGVLALVGYAFYRSVGVKPRRGSNSVTDASDIITDINRHHP
jgi:hypothetical protein